MPATKAQAPAASRQAATGKKQAATVRPFVAGTRRTDEPIYDHTVTLGSTSVDLPTLEVDPNGFFAGLWVDVQGTTAANAANTAFNPDGPFNVLDLVNLQDVNSQPLVGPMNGFDLYLVDKWGGYSFQDDPRSSRAFSVTTGTAATGGSFRFILWVPIEVVKRDALGALPNKSASSTFSLNMRAATAASVYATAPTTPPSVRVRVSLEGWQDPNLSDMRGNPVTPNPPAVQTTQYWHKQRYTIGAGALFQRLLGIDSLVRTLIIVARDGSNARSAGDANFPDPFTLQYETSLIVNRQKSLWQHKMSRDWGYAGAVETAGGQDLGVYVLPFNQDFQAKVGYESRFGYLPVSSATNMVMSGTLGGSGAQNWDILVNKVVPANGNPLGITGGR